MASGGNKQIEENEKDAINGGSVALMMMNEDRKTNWWLEEEHE